MSDEPDDVGTAHPPSRPPDPDTADADTADAGAADAGAADADAADAGVDHDAPRPRRASSPHIPPPTTAPAMSPLAFERLDVGEMRRRAQDLVQHLSSRRSVRAFSTEPIPLDVLDACIRAAATAPSGANKQPWTFCVVTDPALKRRIREAAEAEERAFYGGRASTSWLNDLAHLGTDANKPFLEEAPAIVVLFAQNRSPTGGKHYYISESVGIAAGFFIAALHRCGLATLTHTPSPMAFLSEILGRPRHERAYLLLPVGYPARDCEVPVITRKPLDEVLIRYDAS